MLTEKGRRAQIAALENATAAPSYAIALGLGVETLVVLHDDTIDEAWLRCPDGTEMLAPGAYHYWLNTQWRAGRLPEIDEWIRAQREDER